MTQFSLTTIKSNSRKELLASIREELSKILLGNNIGSSWYVDDMKVSFCVNESPHNTSVYVRLTINNSCGIIFFDDFPEIEKTIKDMVKGATNFTLGSGTLFKPRVGFVV